MADTLRTYFGCWRAEPQWTAPPGGCKNHRRKRRRGEGGRKGRERWGETGGVKFIQGMLKARWKVKEEDEKPKEERRWEAQVGETRGPAGEEEEGSENRARESSPEKDRTKGWTQSRSEGGKERRSLDYLARPISAILRNLGLQIITFFNKT